MLSIIKDNQGNIIAACEWRRVNPQGQYDKDGKLIWINNVEISKSYEHKGLLYKIIKDITDKVPEAEFGYFKREKYDNRIRGYTRKQWIGLIKEKTYEYALA